MKKKLFALILVLCTLFAAIAAFSSCGGSASESTNSLTLDKKYIYYDEGSSGYLNLSQPDEKQIYYIFHSGKTGEYHHYSEVNHRAYTVKFKYITIENESVICFYDSVEYDEKYHTDTYEVSSVWSRTLLYSPEYISATNGDDYVCETYLNKELSNFGK